MKGKTRHAKFIDQRVQGALARRVAAYWTLCLVGMFVMLVTFQAVLIYMFRFEDAPTIPQLVAQTWRMLWPVMVASLIPMPMVIWDVVRLSNRFVGPMHRLRKAMQQAALGEPVPPLKFREGDFWYEFAEDFNRLIAARPATAAPATDDIVDSALEAMRVADRMPFVSLDEEPSATPHHA